jgi:hypothetical protein
MSRGAFWAIVWAASLMLTLGVAIGNGEAWQWFWLTLGIGAVYAMGYAMAREDAIDKQKGKR